MLDSLEVSFHWEKRGSTSPKERIEKWSSGCQWEASLLKMLDVTLLLVPKDMILSTEKPEDSREKTARTNK